MKRREFIKARHQELSTKANAEAGKSGHRLRAARIFVSRRKVRRIPYSCDCSSIHGHPNSADEALQRLEHDTPDELDALLTIRSDGISSNVRSESARSSSR